MVKLIFFVEILVLSGRYVKEHAKYTVYEREIVGNEDHGEEIFGIGIDGEQKEVFWFYQYKEEN